MNSGMFASLSGNLKAEKRMDIIGHNLSNINTPGYKRDKIGFEAMLADATSNQPPMYAQSMTADPILQKDQMYIDYSPGLLTPTGNTYDMAIEGDGFFVVETPKGIAYTRQGNYKVDTDGNLVTVDGFQVQGQNGSIRVKGAKIEISTNGEVSVDGNKIDTLKLVDFPKPYQLNKIGNALFEPKTPQTTTVNATGQLRQGYIEGSNVETITEMALMIQASRDYDSYSKVIKGFDDMNNKAVNELGRL